MRPVTRALALATATALLLAACAGGASPSPSPEPASQAPGGQRPSANPDGVLTGSVTVYSGRSEELVGPLIEQFREATGVEVEVRYGDTAELAATILEEGDASPADVFFAQDAGALGALAAEGRFAMLPQETLDAVEPRFRSPDGEWVGLSGRARVVAYDTRTLAETELPDSILDYTDPAWKGRIGWAPTNASLQAFVTALRVLEGEDAARAWLEGIQANEPKVYDGNNAVLSAIAAGEIEVGFVNHYYLMRQLAEQGERFPVRNDFLPGDDPGSLVNVAGAGVLTTSENATAALAFVDFLLTEDAQTYFAEETFEYPLIEGVPPDPNLPPLDEIESPDIDLSDLDDLAGTLELMQEAGVL